MTDETSAGYLGPRAAITLKVSQIAVERAMEGFPLPLVIGKDHAWLSMAVGRALSLSVRELVDGPDRVSDADSRDDLRRLSTMCRSTWRELFESEPATYSQIFRAAWRQWDGEGGNVSEPKDLRRFREVVSELDWLADFLSAAADTIATTRGPWREKERKSIRVQRAQLLAPIFEAAFGEPVSANNHPSDARHPKPTAFMSFYQSMTKLAFADAVDTNLSEVVKTACRLHKQNPVEFSEGVIPGLVGGA